MQGNIEYYRRLATTCQLDGVHATHIRHRARQLLERGHDARELAKIEKETIRNDFTYIIGLPEWEQDVNREMIRPDCMAIALCVAAWSMLTWNTQWLFGLSSCKIVPAKFSDGQSLLAFSPSCCQHVRVPYLTSTTRTQMLTYSAEQMLMQFTSASVDKSPIPTSCCHSRGISVGLSDICPRSGRNHTFPKTG